MRHQSPHQVSLYSFSPARMPMRSRAVMSSTLRSPPHSSSIVVPFSRRSTGSTYLSEGVRLGEGFRFSVLVQVGYNGGRWLVRPCLTDWVDVLRDRLVDVEEPGLVRLHHQRAGVPATHHPPASKSTRNTIRPHEGPLPHGERAGAFLW